MGENISIDKGYKVETDQTGVGKKIRSMMVIFPYGFIHTFFLAKNMETLLGRTCSSFLNGSDLEQTVHNKIGRLSVEWVHIWNE